MSIYKQKYLILHISEHSLHLVFVLISVSLVSMIRKSKIKGNLDEYLARNVVQLYSN